MKQYLENWAALNQALRDMDEESCRKLLLKEREGRRRVGFLLRIYGRYNTLRCARERKELVFGK